MNSKKFQANMNGDICYTFASQRINCKMGYACSVCVCANRIIQENYELWLWSCLYSSLKCNKCYTRVRCSFNLWKQLFPSIYVFVYISYICLHFPKFTVGKCSPLIFFIKINNFQVLMYTNISIRCSWIF